MEDFKYTKVGYFFERAKRFFERLKMSDTEYRIMKGESQMYKDMLSAIKWDIRADYEDIIDINDSLIRQIPKGKTAIAHINIVEMLEKGGITPDKNVIWDITGI